MADENWIPHFGEVHARGVAAWHAHKRSPASMFSREDADFLKSIGCSTRELFDFIDDLGDYGEPDFETVLAVQAIRLRYFREVMGGQPARRQATMAELPSKADAVDGISWLPRLIVKARLKLRGEMPPELMYGCGGDRPFLRRMKSTLPAFLQLVWDCGEDDRKIIESVKQTAGFA
ncbi:MAG: DUF5069 domain-containing protein [Verrucomicrobia bacterium]|nr:DUF5069 domain-containing protein [Verrucomicrobiota bacterium]